MKTKNFWITKPVYHNIIVKLQKPVFSKELFYAADRATQVLSDHGSRLFCTF